MMPDEEKCFNAFCTLLDLDPESAREFVDQTSMANLLKNPYSLIDGDPIKTEKYKLLCDLHRNIRIISSQTYQIDTSQDFAEFALGRMDFPFDRETLVAVFTDAKRRPIAVENVSSGGRSATFVDISTILRRALMNNASGLFLVHNHPSGDTTPSNADILRTRQLASAGALVSITLHDSLVIDPISKNYTSIRKICPDLFEKDQQSKPKAKKKTR